MKLIDVKVRTLASTYDPHRLELLVDRIPPLSEVVHETRDIENGRTAYFGELEGYVHFGLHDPRNESGYGGSVFEILTKDGVRSFKGPWSSNPGEMAKLFHRDTVDVSLTDDPAAFDRGYTFFAGHVTLDMAIKAISMLWDRNEPWVLRHGKYHLSLGRLECDTADGPEWCGEEPVRHDTSAFYRR